MPVRISKNRVALENIPLNQAMGANIASAATVNLTTATGNTVHLTGTTSITAVTLGAGMVRDVIFDGSLTLTHHSTNNNLPGGANITTAPNDRARYIADGTTVYCVNYQKANGTAVVASTGASKAFLVGMSADQAVTSAATKVAFNSEVLDDGGNFDSTNNRYICPSAGKYMFSINITWFASAVSRGRAVLLYKNGGGTGHSVETNLAYVEANNTSSTATLVVIEDCAANDFFEVFTSGTTSTSVYGVRSWFSGVKLY